MGELVEDRIEVRSEGVGGRPLIVMFSEAVWNTLFMYFVYVLVYLEYGEERGIYIMNKFFDSHPHLIFSFYRW